MVLLKIFNKHNRTLLGVLFTVLLAALSLAGCYEYYVYYYPAASGREAAHLYSTILFSTMKLFTFSPTVSLGADVPLSYEIAKWLAPLCTVYWLFRALESLFRHSLGVLRRRFSFQRQIVLFGYNKYAEIFIRNILKENEEKTRNSEKSLLLLITEEPLEKETRLALEREHILVYQMNLLNGADSAAKIRFLRHCLNSMDEAAVFYEDAAVSFAILRTLLDCAGKMGSIPKENIPCAIHCEDKVFRKVILDYYDQEETRPFDLNVFSLPEMTVLELLAKEPFYRNCLSRGIACTPRENISAKGLLANVPNPHILIMGFGRHGQAVFEKALLTGTISPQSAVRGYETLRITVIDHEPDRCRDIIESRYPGIRHLCRLEIIGTNIESIRAERALAELPPVTYVAICFESQTVCVSALDKICRFLIVQKEQGEFQPFPCTPVPIAVRMPENDSILELFRRNSGAAVPENISSGLFRPVIFGTEAQVLSHENVVRYQMDRAARDFYHIYCSLQQGKDAAGPLDKEELWRKLSFEHMESCRAQVLNRPYFRELMKELPALPDRDVLFQDFDNTDLFLEKLEKAPDLDMLAYLEHRRWNSFCYTYGYAGYHPDPREKGRSHIVTENGETFYGKVHYCLIDDWEEFKENEQTRKTIVYDVFSVYGYIAE